MLIPDLMEIFDLHMCVFNLDITFLWPLDGRCWARYDTRGCQRTAASSWYNAFQISTFLQSQKVKWRCHFKGMSGHNLCDLPLDVLSRVLGMYVVNSFVMLIA